MGYPRFKEMDDLNARVDKTMRLIPGDIPKVPDLHARVRYRIRQGFNPRLVANHVIFTWKVSQDTV